MPTRRLAFLLFSLMVIAAAAWLAVGRLSLFSTAAIVENGLPPARKLVSQRVLWLTGKSEARQEFVAQYPGLSEIELFLTAPPDAPASATVLLHLRTDCAARQDVRQVRATVAPESVGDGRFVPFIFAPLDDSAGQKYCLIVQADPAAGDALAVGVWASDRDVYPDGRGEYVGPQTADRPAVTASPAVTPPAEARYRVFLPLVMVSPPARNLSDIDIGFHLSYRGRPVDTLAAFARRLTVFKPYVWGSPWFYVGVVAVYLVGVLALGRFSEPL